MESADELRAALRDFLSSHAHPSARAPFDERRDWNATLFDGGWAAPAWPARFGGRDAGVLEQLAYHEEMAAAGAPGPVNAIGVANIAPAIMAYGTGEQQERFLRPMLRGDDVWSQGMSEPGAGSDLASLACRGVLDGDAFVVNGQKTWNSNGHVADWCQLYVRTNTEAPKHKGITCLLVDMRTPGIEARPITTMAGDTSFAEVFLTDVRIPVTSVLGRVDEGWHVATRTLSNERAGVGVLARTFRKKVDDLLGSVGSVSDPLVRQDLARRYSDARLLGFLADRTLAATLAGRAPGPEGSVVKLAWSQHEQALALSAVGALGIGALDGSWGTALLSSRSLTIAGGTTEVNKNIVGERVLGLPKEPG